MGFRLLTPPISLSDADGVEHGLRRKADLGGECITAHAWDFGLGGRGLFSVSHMHSKLSFLPSLNYFRPPEPCLWFPRLCGFIYWVPVAYQVLPDRPNPPPFSAWKTPTLITNPAQMAAAFSRPSGTSLKCTPV